MSLVDVLGGLLRPAVCLACGVPGVWPCCARCLPAEPDDVGPWPLAADPDVALWALGPYRDALRAAVLAGKLDGQPAALTELGRRLGIALATAGVGADLVTYVAAAQVPGPPRDHAERVAAGVATTLDLPLVGLLTPAGGPDLGRARRADRARRAEQARRADRLGGAGTPEGAGPLGAAGRLDAADRPGAGGPDHPGRSARPPLRRPPPTARYRLGGGRVLLVDDLATTGGTLAGAAAALRHAGARQVEAAVLAVAPTALGPGPGPSATRRSWSDPGQPGEAGPTPRQPAAPGPIPRRSACPPLPTLGRLPPGPQKPRPPARPDRFRACLAPSPARLGPVGRGVSRWRYDRDLPCSWRSHCVVVTRFRV
jgi:predicted amidophosphoribosyltransferase